ANAFIAKAAAEIKKASPNPFIEAEIADSRNPLQLQPSAAIRFALEEYQKDLAKRNIPYAIAATLAQRAKDYAALMNTDNFMLDLPFFLALRQPFLIIEKIANSYYTIIAISDNFRINGKIDAFKIDDVNVVSYNGGQEGQIGNHYQPLILDTDIHKNAMRQVIVNTINGHINNFIQGIKEPGAPSTKKQRRNADNYIKAIRIYPAAKDDIIEKLKLDYPAKAPALDLLKASPDNNFAPALHDCIHSHS
ncbi:MAG TPA: hypothetical protein VMR37_06630, partial [Rhabdochlamydiaceae bacterium]|nr:hypothetical protein [Rhabdochlamydiaceae bacterium]